MVITCDDCGSRTRVTKVWHRSDGAVMRRRECDSCGKSAVTVERLLGSLAFCRLNATDVVEKLEELGIPIDRDR